MKLLFIDFTLFWTTLGLFVLSDAGKMILSPFPWCWAPKNAAKSFFTNENSISEENLLICFKNSIFFRESYFKRMPKKNLQHFWESRAEFWSPGLSYGNNTWNTSPQKHCKIIFLLPFEAFFVKKTVFLSKKDENSILQHFYEDCSAQYCCPGPSKFNFHPHLPLQHLLRPPGNEKKYFFVCSVRNKIKKENPTNI